MAIKLYHAQLTITNGSSFLMPGAQSRLVRQTDPPHSLRQFRYATFLLLTFLLAIAGLFPCMRKPVMGRLWEPSPIRREQS